MSVETTLFPPDIDQLGYVTPDFRTGLARISHTPIVVTEEKWRTQKASGARRCGSIGEAG